MKYAWSQSLDSFLLLTSRDSRKGEPSRSQVKSVQTASHLIGVGLSQENEYLMAYFRGSSSFMAGPVCSVLMGVSVPLVIDGFFTVFYAANLTGLVTQRLIAFVLA